MDRSDYDLGLRSMVEGDWSEKALAYKTWLTRDEVLLIAAPNRAILAYDVRAGKQIAFIGDASEADLAAGLHLTPDRSMLLQINENGRLFVYRLRDKKRILSGYYIDDEIIIHQDDGYYSATPEGAHFIYLKFPGVDGYHSFHQFSRTLNRPDIIRSVLTGGGAAPSPQLTVPPALQVAADTSGAGRPRTATLRYRVSSSAGLQRLVVYVDGRPVTEQALAGRAAEASLTVPLGANDRWITAVAVDTTGHESVPQGQQLTGGGDAGGSRLFAVIVGTDTYDDPKISPLYAARRDASSFAQTLSLLKGSTYSDIISTSMLDEPELKSKLPAQLRKVASDAGPNDTIVLFAAGHGTQGADGRFYLVTRASQHQSIEGTALSWDEIAAAIEGAKARVVIFLDACRSGAAGGAGSNDDAVSALLGRSVPITVIAAAKGRQDSLEADSGGYFTNAIIRAVSGDRRLSDSNGNGVIELAELYAAVKSEVVRATDGAQTPWIARNLMVGEIPLF